MLGKMVVRSWGSWATAVESLRDEIQLSWLFVRRDISSTVVPAWLFSAAAALSSHATVAGLLGTELRSTVYAWLYCYVFCVSNQLAGIDEDRVNKPDRPLVRGAVSLRGAWQRWIVLMLIFPLVGWWFGVLHWALLWQLVLVLHNMGGWAKHWFTKNLSMSLGVIAGLGAAWQIATPITPDAWRWILALAGVVFPLVAVQDLRDMDGDRISGRSTLPLAIGAARTRWLLGAGFVLLPVALHFALTQPEGQTWNVWLCELGLALVSLTLAIRVLLYRSSQSDHQTYLLFTYWYCLTLLSASIIL